MGTTAPLEVYLTSSHHFSAVGVDLHQKVVLITAIDHNFVMRHRTKQPSSFQNSDFCIIEDAEDSAQASCQVSHSLTESGWSSDM